MPSTNYALAAGQRRLIAALILSAAVLAGCHHAQDQPEAPVASAGSDTSLAPMPPRTTNRPLEVLRVLAGTPAEKAGLRPHDVLVSVNGEALQSGLELSHHMAAVHNGKPIRMDIERGASFQTLTVTFPADRPVFGVEVYKDPLPLER